MFQCELVSVAGIVHTKNRETATLLGLVKRQSAFTPVQDIKPRADFESVFQRSVLIFILMTLVWAQPLVLSHHWFACMKTPNFAFLVILHNCR